MAILIGITAAGVCMRGNIKEIGRVADELKVSIYEEILQFYMPGVCYGQSEEKTIAEEVLSLFFMSEYEHLPAESQNAGDKTYVTQVESDLSYETILAKEASDENYVDEVTGEVVMMADTPDISGEQMNQTGTGLARQEEEQAQTIPAAAADSGRKVTYAREKLNDFDYLIQNFYQVDSSTTITGEQLQAGTLLGKDMRLSHDASTPQILIYHTHSQECYADSTPGDPTQSVVGVGDYLTKLLTEQYGFRVIHHTGEYDVGDRDHAYSKAGPALEKILEENPSIEVVIDLHRDGVAENTRLVTTQNGVQMAQVMFFNGLSRTTGTGDIDYLYNPYLEDNLAMSFQMQLKAAEYYPDFTRRIYLKSYRYNMHYCPKTLLIEVGAQTNTLEEAMNAMVPLADVLNKVLTGAAEP